MHAWSRICCQSLNEKLKNGSEMAFVAEATKTASATRNPSWDWMTGTGWKHNWYWKQHSEGINQIRQRRKILPFHKFW